MNTNEPIRIAGNIRTLRTLPLAMTLVAVFAEYEAGYTAFGDRRGPGNGRIRAAGWLQAHRNEVAELEERQEARRSQF